VARVDLVRRAIIEGNIASVRYDVHVPPRNDIHVQIALDAVLVATYV